MLGTQAPYFYRFKLGNAEATVVSDGPLPLGDPHKNFLGLTAAEMDKQLTDNFLPLENAVLEQNALVLNTGEPSRAVRYRSRHACRSSARPPAS